MNPEHLTSLKQAADLIKLGKTKPARGLIIEVLRNDPNNAQAWYMLSFTVPHLDKQIYALEQTIKIAPDHQKALSRLEKLSGELTQNQNEEDSVQPSIPSRESAKPKLSPPKIDSSGDDLLSQRLFGEAPEIVETPENEVEEEIPAKPAVFYHEIAEQAGQGDEDEIQTEIDIDDEQEQKVFGVPRRHFLTVIVILIVIFFAILGFSPRIIDLLRNSSPVQQAGISTLESKAQATETFPPTSTPTPIQPTRTLIPTPIGSNLFSTTDLIPPTESTFERLETIQLGIQVFLDTVTTPDADVFTISEPRLQSFIWDYAKFIDFDEEVSKNQRIFEVLGLAEPGDDFSSFYQNIWADPNGTLYIPEKNIIGIVGFEFSEYQQYSYAQAVVQNLRDQQHSYQSLGIYPPCIEFSQECDVSLALAKGEAAFSARQWLLGTVDEETINEIDQTTLKLYFSPVSSPAFVMEAIRLFPYLQGYSFVEEVFIQNGIDGVENLYSNIPTTTEQILHPEKYLAGEVGTPIESTDLASFLPDGWQPIYQASLGEWKTYLVLTSGAVPSTRINAEDGRLAAEGWNGDYTQVFTTASGENLVIAHWKFDSPTDVTEFSEAFTKYNSQRFIGEPFEVLGNTCIDIISQISCLVITDEDVIWLQAPNRNTIELILVNYEYLNEE